jgi:hypothetical protein
MPLIKRSVPRRIPAVQEHCDILGDDGLGYFAHLPLPTRGKREDLLGLFLRTSSSLGADVPLTIDA